MQYEAPSDLLIQTNKQVENKEASVYLTPAEEKLRFFLDIKTPKIMTLNHRDVTGLILEFLGIQKMTAHNGP